MKHIFSAIFFSIILFFGFRTTVYAGLIFEGIDNVGIGTTSPQAKLHIVQTAAGDAFRVDDDSGDTTPFIITQNGSVGIGTASPDAKLDVQGGDIRIGALYAIESSGTFYLEPGTGIVGLGINQVGVLDILNGVTTKIRINSGGDSYFNGGYVGIGTENPNAPLDIKSTNAGGQIRLYNADSGGNAFFLNHASDNSFNISHSLSRRFTIDSTGKVGIGTTAPGQALDVAGTIRQSRCKTAGTLSANTSGDIICTSDERQKDIYGFYQGGIRELSAINPIRFSYKGEDFVHVGFSAQNVKGVIPEASALQDNGYLSLDATAVTALTVNSIKELQQQITSLKNIVADQQKQIDNLSR